MNQLAKKIIIGLVWGLVWLLTLAPAGVSAVEKKSQAANEDSAFMELIEFIGSFETADGGWLDPLELEDVKELDSPLNDDAGQTPKKKESEGGS
jgi:hypothetical protein